MDFKSGNFPPGLLNRASDAAQASWCKWLLGAECNTRRDFFFNLFFTGHGIWLLLPLSFLLLIVYRLVGPPEVCSESILTTISDRSNTCIRPILCTNRTFRNKIVEVYVARSRFRIIFHQDNKLEQPYKAWKWRSSTLWRVSSISCGIQPEKSFHRSM